MIRPGLALAMWLATAALMLANHAIGDTLIASAGSARAVEWYKTLVPIPYVAFLAALHARHTAGPAWLAAALLPAAVWPVSTALVDALYLRLTFDEPWEALADRYAVEWGAPFPLLLAVLALAPPLAGWIVARRGRAGGAPPPAVTSA